MNREEKIDEAGKIYSKNCVALKFPAKRFNLKVSDIIAAHRNGAEWADSNPREGLVDIEDVIDFIFKNTAYFESIDDANNFIDNLRKQFN